MHFAVAFELRIASVSNAQEVPLQKMCQKVDLGSSLIVFISFHVTLTKVAFVRVSNGSVSLGIIWVEVLVNTFGAVHVSRG